ncbi:hypothetical protein Egran_04829 [Elaphomyces granulatus]|uniref:Complex 1 LYR protein domain-containing protein n=1 Tax=Elaphomyces granulatus TaxID=519963 RepID=A0A232LTE9_9EURO|nr:hypothetical protein Egran_04829 [Elaphomyces granulatus]
MHKVVVPKRSGIHRFACLALYRALLRKCSRLPLTVASPVSVKFLVQYKFRRCRNIQSPSQVINALQAGYEAVDLLHSTSQGNESEIYRLQTLLSEGRSLRLLNASEHRELTNARCNKPLSALDKKKAESRRYQRATAYRHPNAQPILSRPRPVVSGRRRVPVLVSARGVPFLRIKKPQPKILSDVIRTKLDKRWNRILLRDRLQAELLLAKDEDDWDGLVGDETLPSWTSEIRVALEEVIEKIQGSDQKNKELAEAMWNVVLSERKLAEEEAERRGLEIQPQSFTNPYGTFDAATMPTANDEIN